MISLDEAITSALNTLGMPNATVQQLEEFGTELMRRAESETDPEQQRALTAALGLVTLTLGGMHFSDKWREQCRTPGSTR